MTFIKHSVLRGVAILCVVVCVMGDPVFVQDFTGTRFQAKPVYNRALHATTIPRLGGLSVLTDITAVMLIMLVCLCGMCIVLHFVMIGVFVAASLKEQDDGGTEEVEEKSDDSWSRRWWWSSCYW